LDISPVATSQQSYRRSLSESSEAPILFERKPSISSAAKLSINVSLHGDAEAQSQFRGPTIEFKNICYSVRNPNASQGYLSVLNDVSGRFDWGKLSLVLGARGSGRSSLLHVLAGSRGLAAKVSGVVRFDGKPMDRSTPLWKRCGLVEASDELHGDLTVEDILRFAMQLRCPNLEAFAYVEENVTRTINLLHLDQVRKTRAKRLTNGELKRLSIAEELVHGPGLLLIDEPTTSQDLRDESIMLQTFRELVNQDRTVIASIQTPSERILQLFDVVLLLSKGSVIYHGPMAMADKFFTSSPYKFSLTGYDNRGDFLTDISGGYLECVNGTIPGSRELAAYFRSGKDGNGSNGDGNMISSDNSSRNNSMYMYKAPQLSKEFSDDAIWVSATAALEEPLIVVEKDATKTFRSQIYKAVPLIYMLPHIIAACTMSVWNYFIRIPSTDWDLYLRQSSVIIRRSFLSMYRRKKLWITSIITYILLAALLGMLAGNVVLQAYLTISLYAIGPLLLFFTNIQIVYYTFRTDMVS
jgi:ABC-type multidrug transport system ATPase subunit